MLTLSSRCTIHPRLARIGLSRQLKTFSFLSALLPCYELVPFDLKKKLLKEGFLHKEYRDQGEDSCQQKYYKGDPVSFRRVYITQSTTAVQNQAY